MARPRRSMLAGRAAGLWLDAGLALLIAVFLVAAERQQVFHTVGATQLDAVAEGAVAGAGIVLALRRLLPVLTYAATVLLTGVFLLRGNPGGAIWLAPFIALLTLVAVLPAAQWTVAALAGAMLLAVMYVASGGSPLAAGLWSGAWLVVATLFALGLAVRRRFALEAEARGELAQQSREERALRRMAEERLSIAREMHDVVGHSLAVISLQAGVAEHLLESRPEEVRNAVAAIRKVSREALTELRAELAVLRGDGAAPERRPAPDLRSVPALVSAMRDAGVDVELEMDAKRSVIPELVGAAAYRITQESLTNVARHAGPGARAIVRVQLGGRDLQVEIRDNGPGATSTPSGTGIDGMQERVAALGGRFSAGNGPQGGFRIWASIPVPPS